MNTEAKQAFLTALERTSGSHLRRFLARRLRNAAADVPDLMQEVFLRLLRIPSHETLRDPQAYLYTVASHALHQHLLHDSGAAAELPLAETEAEKSELTKADVEIDRRFESLVQSLQQQSPSACAALLLHRREGMTVKEVAERLGVSESMVKRYLAIALSFCHQKMQEE